VRVSYVEIYNEVISDLATSKPTTLRIHEDAVRGVFVSGLLEEIVTSAEQVLQFMQLGESRRHVGATRMNDQSSRSHTLFRFLIESRVRNAADGDAAGKRPKESMCDDAGGVMRVSQLNLVDLAGSERVAHSGAAGQQLREGAHINKSLLTLGNVIGKLADLADASAAGSAATGAAHVPYRDSKLTRILQTGLGGNARTAIVCTVTPAACHFDETLSTLKFANRAKRIRNQPRVNELLDDKALVRRCQREIDELQRRLAASNADATEARIAAIAGERDAKEQELEHVRGVRLAKLARLEAFLAAGTPHAVGAGKPPASATASTRRDTCGPDDLRQARTANNDDDDDDESNDDHDAAPDTDASAREPLERPHDGHTIDFGMVLRAAHADADRLAASNDTRSAALAPAVTVKREHDIELWMLPQKVRNEIVALRHELARVTESSEAHTSSAAAAMARMSSERAQALADAEHRALALAAAQRAAADASAHRELARSELASVRAHCDALELKLQTLALAAAESTELECGKLRAVSATLAAERDAARGELRAAQRDEKAAVRQAESCQRDLARLTERHAKLESAMREAGDGAAAATARAAAADVDARRMADRVAQLELEVTAARSDTTRTDALAAELSALRDSHAALVARADAHRRAAGDAGDALADAEARADALGSELVDAHQQLAGAEAERDSARSACASTAAALDVARRDLEVARADATAQRVAVDAARAAAVTAAAQHTRALALLDARCVKANDDAARLAAQLDDVQQSLSRASSERDATLAELERTRDDAAAAAKAHVVALAAANAERDARIADVLRIESTLEAARSDIASAVNNGSSLLAELERTTSELHVTQRAARDAAETHARTDAHNDAERAELRVTVAALVTQLTVARAANESAAAAAGARTRCGTRRRRSARRRRRAARGRARCAARDISGLRSTYVCDVSNF
jgi:centromeric protein E